MARDIVLLPPKLHLEYVETRALYAVPCLCQPLRLLTALNNRIGHGRAGRGSVSAYKRRTDGSARPPHPSLAPAPKHFESVTDVPDRRQYWVGDVEILVAIRCEVNLAAERELALVLR